MNRFWQIIILVTLLSGGAVFVGRSLNGRTPGTAKQPLPPTNASTAKVGTAVGDAAPDFELASIDGAPASTHTLAPFFVEAGFAAGAMGLQAISRLKMVDGRC